MAVGSTVRVRGEMMKERRFKQARAAKRETYRCNLSVRSDRGLAVIGRLGREGVGDGVLGGHGCRTGEEEREQRLSGNEHTAARYQA